MKHVCVGFKSPLSTMIRGQVFYIARLVRAAGRAQLCAGRGRAAAARHVPDRGGAVGGRSQQCRGPHRCSRAASRRPRDLPDAGRRQLRPGRSPDSSGSSACGGEPRLRSALLADSDGGAQNRRDLRSVPWRTSEAKILTWHCRSMSIQCAARIRYSDPICPLG